MANTIPNIYMPYNASGNNNQNPYGNNNFQTPSFQQYMPQPSPPQPQQQMLKGRPVSSVDEARAAQIDYDGSLFIFPDITGKKIYTRQVMLDGTSMFNTYSLDESVDAKKTPYVMRDEFENTVSDINTALLTLKNYIERTADDGYAKPSPAATADDVVSAF